MIILGLTGGIGAGKSTVSAMFAEHAIPVFDYDAEVHKLYKPGSPSAAPIYRFFKQRLPESTTNTFVNKRVVSDHAFADLNLLRDIEIEFSYYLDIILAKWLSRHKWRLFSPIVLLDVPMIFPYGLAEALR